MKIKIMEKKDGLFTVTYENVVGEKWSWDGVLNPELGELLTISKDGFDYDWKGFNEWMGKENLTHREKEALVALAYSIGEHEAEQAAGLLQKFIDYSFPYQSLENEMDHNVLFELSPQFEDIMNGYKKYVLQNGLENTLHKNYSDFLEACNYLLPGAKLLSPAGGPCVEWVNLGDNIKFLQMRLSELMLESGNGLGNEPVYEFLVISGKNVGTISTVPDYMWHIIREELGSDLISANSVFEYLSLNAIGPKLAKFSFAVGGSELFIKNKVAKKNIEIYELQRVFDKLDLNGTFVGSGQGIFLLDYEFRDLQQSTKDINEKLTENEELNGKKELAENIELTEKDIIDYVEFYFKGNSSEKTIEELEEIREKVEVGCGVIEGNSKE